MDRKQKPYKLVFELPGLPATINAIGRKYWRVKADEARLWRSAVVWSVKNKRPEKPLKRAQVHYVRISSSAIDRDNLVGSFKHVQDGLVDAGIIANDKYETLITSYSWEKGEPKKGKIRVELIEIPIESSDATPPQLISEREMDRSWEDPSLPFGHEGFKERKRRTQKKT